MDFDPMDIPGSAVVAPLTRDRIEAALKELDFTYHIDSEGDIGGLWEYNLFNFLLSGRNGSVLHINGRWRRDLPLDLREEVGLVINDWHRDLFWPKAYTRVDDEGRLWVFAEVATDWEDGITNAQLIRAIRDAIYSSLHLFDHLDTSFPSTTRPGTVDLLGGDDDE